MRKQMLLSATALLAAIGFASAQGASQGVEGANKAPSSVSESPSAPQDRAAGAKRSRGQDEGKSQAQNRSQESQDKSEKGRSQNQSQQSSDHGRAKSETSGQAQDESRRDKSNGEAQRSQAEKRLERDNQKKERSSQAQGKGGNKGEAKRNQDNAQSARDKSQRDQTNGQAAQRQGEEKSQQSRSDRSGHGAEPQPAEKLENRASSTNSPSDGGARAQAQGVSLTAEQQTRIQRTVIANRNVPRLNRVNFSVAVGTTVPVSVEIIDVPPALVEIYPQWRGNSVVVVRDEIVIVDNSRKIVAVVPASSSRTDVGGHSARAGNGGSAIADLGPGGIREVQLVLIQRGFLVGEADGIFGPDTRAALVKFQRDNGIEATGSIDIQTVNKMRLSDKLNARGAVGNQPSQAERSGAHQPGGQREQAKEQPKSEPQQGTTGQGGPAVGGRSRDSQPDVKEEQQPSGTPSMQRQRDGDMKDRPSGNKN